MLLNYHTYVVFYSLYAEFQRLKTKLNNETLEQEIDDRLIVAEMAQDNSPLKREHD